MEIVSLGNQGLRVGKQGFGCMNLSTMYAAGVPKQDAKRCLDRALDLGVTLLDTADIYAGGENETLVGDLLERGREVTVSTKGGLVNLTDPVPANRICADPAYLKKACDESLKRLQRSVIDLYFLHRVDPRIPVEDSVGALAELVQAGKIRYIGLSEVTGETLRRAHRIHPITALESEWSLFSRDIESGPLQAARELGVGIVPYGPLARGLLTGMWSSPADLSAEDQRRSWPWFQDGNFPPNLDRVGKLAQIARANGMSLPSLALAWVHSRGGDVVPIPGANTVAQEESNVAASEVTLTREVLLQIEEVIPRGSVAGDRYPDMSWVEGTTPLPSEA